MPLLKGKSSKAFSKNVETEMSAGKPQKQALAIAYSTQRRSGKKKMAAGGAVDDPMEKKAGPNTQAAMDSIRKAFGPKKSKGGMMYAEGGEIRAASSRPDVDDEDERELEMARKSRGELRHRDEITAPEEHMSGIDDARDEREMDMMYAEGGEIDFADEKMDTVDDMRRKRSMNMLDSKPLSHMSEKRAATKMVDEDDEDDMEMGMLHSKAQPDVYSKEGIINYAEGGSVADRIRRKYSAGDTVDQQANADEDLNEEDQLSFEAPRKKTYYDDSQLSDQPEDSNEHGDELSDADSHDMVSSIRKKMRSKRM